jgi:4a-hydroxytetrahydrobiopterin dehydratase
MEDLLTKKCKPCEGGTPPLRINEIKEYMRQLSDGWKLEGDRKITRQYSFVNFRHTMDFVNKVASLAEDEGHHPVMHVHYGRVDIELWTHAINGLSENDFILAAKIDSILL